eukprot:GEMP01066612.1.p1 GENE.GEMP01066612.1~~GEMP01066612.1.p1  ORF type:complete len:117 (+),score=14.46 GEMP01066612.1:562-912(+)
MMAGRNCIFSVPFFLWWAQMAKKPRLRAEMHRLKDDDKFNTIHHMSAKEWVMFLLRPGTRTRNFPYVPPLPDDFFLCFFLRFAFYASRVSETNNRNFIRNSELTKNNYSRCRRFAT